MLEIKYIKKQGFPYGCIEQHTISDIEPFQMEGKIKTAETIYFNKINNRQFGLIYSIKPHLSFTEKQNQEIEDEIFLIKEANNIDEYLEKLNDEIEYIVLNNSIYFGNIGEN